MKVQNPFWLLPISLQPLRISQPFLLVEEPFPGRMTSFRNMGGSDKAPTQCSFTQFRPLDVRAVHPGQVAQLV